jgi:hypothetical protein
MERALSKKFLFFFYFKKEHGQFFDNIYQRYSPCLLARSTGFSFSRWPVKGADRTEPGRRTLCAPDYNIL